MRRIIFLALLTLTWLSVSQEARAQEYPLTPDPSTCDAEPIDIEALLDLVATPSASPSATPEPTPRTPTAEEFGEMSEAVIASVACTNANQPLRALSYFTDDFLLNRISAEPAVTLGHLAAASSRAPDVADVEDRVTIDALSPGSAGDMVAYIEVTTVSGGEPSLSSLRMVSTSSGWKIDAVSLVIVD